MKNMFNNFTKSQIFWFAFLFSGFLLSANIEYIYFKDKDYSSEKHCVLELSENTHLTRIPLSESELETLEATLVINGNISNEYFDRITLFNALWESEDSRLKVTHHTPEICWLGSGWTILNEGQPHVVNMESSTGDIVEFEMNIFQNKISNSNEIVVWSILINGEASAESRSVGLDLLEENIENYSLRERSLTSSRQLRILQFVNCLKSRETPRGSKQFIRFSKEYTGNWQEDLRLLKKFFKEYIIVKYI